MEWLWKRVNEPTTWLGVGLVTESVGQALGAGQTIWAALAFGVMGVIMREKGK